MAARTAHDNVAVIVTMVSHYLDQVRRVADHVMELADGRLNG